MQAASLQFVRRISGFNNSSAMRVLTA
ncbi:MAG: hypothetical protein DMG52_32685 [Acidobacteria bacterium]|nr:MAG: hypothetical protein DMG52_32685 [Acidobacteriota bacterium]